MTATMVFCHVYLTMLPSLDKTQLEKHDLKTKRRKYWRGYIYNQVWNGKNYFEIVTFFDFERGTFKEWVIQMKTKT